MDSTDSRHNPRRFLEHARVIKKECTRAHVGRLKHRCTIKWLMIDVLFANALSQIVTSLPLYPSLPLSLSLSLCRFRALFISRHLTFFLSLIFISPLVKRCPRTQVVCIQIYSILFNYRCTNFYLYERNNQVIVLYFYFPFVLWHIQYSAVFVLCPFGIFSIRYIFFITWFLRA